MDVQISDSGVRSRCPIRKSTRFSAPRGGPFPLAVATTSNLPPILNRSPNLMTLQGGASRRSDLDDSGTNAILSAVLEK